MSFYFHLDSVPTYDKSLIDVDSIYLHIPFGTFSLPFKLDTFFYTIQNLNSKMKLLSKLVIFSAHASAIDWASDAICYNECCPLETKISGIKDMPKIIPGYKVMGYKDETEETVIVGCQKGYM